MLPALPNGDLKIGTVRNNAELCVLDDKRFVVESNRDSARCDCHFTGSDADAATVATAEDDYPEACDVVQCDGCTAGTQGGCFYRVGSVDGTCVCDLRRGCTSFVGSLFLFSALCFVVHLVCTLKTDSSQRHTILMTHGPPCDLSRQGALWECNPIRSAFLTTA